jgi:hypothetical protein
LISAVIKLEAPAKNERIFNVHAVHPERLLSQFQEWRRVDMQLAPTGSCFPVNIDRQSRINIFFFLTKLDYASLGLSGGSRGKSGDLHCG